MSSPSSNSPPPVTERDHKLGAERPELTLIEYGDFGCPFCYAARRPVESLLERYPAMMLVWHFPDQASSCGRSRRGALGARSDPREVLGGAFLLLAGREHFSLDDLISVAERLELDPEEARSALEERRFRERVEEDVEGARRAGVHGTPTFFVNGERLEGPWRRLREVVPAALEGSGE